MPTYGLPDLDIEYTYVAVRPFVAEHPIGSGIQVQYNPGDEFPGEEWGMSAHTLVEVGKAVRLAVNIAKGGRVEVDPPTPSFGISPVNGNGKPEEVTSYPVRKNAVWWVLSDGSNARGEENARAAQAELDKDVGE